MIKQDFNTQFEKNSSRIVYLNILSVQSIAHVKFTVKGKPGD
jgi:hypothetical protein